MSEFSSKFGVPKLSWWWLLYIRRFLVTASELWTCSLSCMVFSNYLLY